VNFGGKKSKKNVRQKEKKKGECKKNKRLRGKATVLSPRVLEFF
jgi:hypothetical protein